MTLLLRRSICLVGLATISATACGVTPATQVEPAPATVERSFKSGGRVNMHLGAGEYTIEQSAGDQLRVAWTTRDPADARRVQIDARVEGDSAMLRTSGPSNGFAVAIGVPARCDLWIRLSAGDLTIRGIEGHKDVSAWAGELKIAVGDGSTYRVVQTSVLAGEIQAPTLQGSKGGVFRSFSWDGTGKYDLRARLTAGEIHLQDN